MRQADEVLCFAQSPSIFIAAIEARFCIFASLCSAAFLLIFYSSLFVKSDSLSILSAHRMSAIFSPLVLKTTLWFD